MWSDESVCLPQSLRSCHLIAHENPPPSCEVSRYRSVRPLPLKEESGPFFLACAIVARVSACAHYVCHTIWRKLRVCRDFLRIFRRKLPTFYSFLPVFCWLLSCHGHSLRRWRKGVADHRCDVCWASRPPTGLASALGGGDKWQPECRAPSERARWCERGRRCPAARRWCRVRMQFAERAPVSVAPVHKKSRQTQGLRLPARRCAVRCETARAAEQG